MTVKLTCNGVDLPFKKWNFPGGEVGIQLNSLPERYGNFNVTIDGIPSSEDIFVAMNVLDAIHRCGVNKYIVFLSIPYFPYARQDRKCRSGESFALAVFIHMIMSMQHTFGTLYIDDPHSEVTKQLLNDLANKDTHVHSWDQDYFTENLPAFDVIIAPDHGAIEKAKLTQPDKEHVFLSKVRINGEVLYENYAPDTIVGSAIIVDDILDGAKTFISAAEMLQKTQPRMTDLSLYCTHGIFSKGYDIVKEHFDNIYIANPMTEEANKANKVTY